MEARRRRRARQPHARHLPPHTALSVCATRAWEYAWKALKDAGACDTDAAAVAARRYAVFVSGGMHYGVDVNATLRVLYEPAMRDAQAVAAACNATPLFVGAGLGVQRRFVDAHYAHQSRERTLKFNTELAAQLAAAPIDLLDFWNLTRDAPTSDGVHGHSDVNLYKAVYFFNHLALHVSER